MDALKTRKKRGYAMRMVLRNIYVLWMDARIGLRTEVFALLTAHHSKRVMWMDAGNTA
jgi:hypothetical protein